MKYSLWYILIWMFTVIIRMPAAEVVEHDSWVYKDPTNTTTVYRQGDLVLYQSNDVTTTPWYIAIVISNDQDGVMVERPVSADGVMVVELVQQEQILGVATNASKPLK